MCGQKLDCVPDAGRAGITESRGFHGRGLPTIFND
jgi:hypothetical protein